MRVCVVTASGQNVFFAELLEAFTDGLAQRSVEIEHAVDCFPELTDDLVYLFIPHEFMPLTDPESHPTPRQLRRSVAVCTEQPGTSWFEGAVAVAGRCGAAVDINDLGVAALADRGIRSRLVALGYVAAWDHWGGSEAHERPVDLSFMGTVTDRRELALARCGSVLQHRRASLHLREATIPHHADDEYFLSGAAKWDALAGTKAILNVHRSELAYMEWLRVLGAVINGCVVITEHALGFAPFVPNRHFVSTAYDDLHLAVGALLDDPDRVAAIRRESYAFVRDEMPMTTSIDSLLEALDDVARHPYPPARPGEPKPIARPRHAVMPEPWHLTRDAGDAEVVRMALKNLIVETTALRREVERLRDAGAEARPDRHVEIGPYAAVTPQVSVVVTVYNYADYVGEALASVARSDHDAYEIVVVDDHSTDASRDVVRSTLAESPWVAAKLVERGRNQGLAAARNAGVEAARGDYVFMLDADNTVYPHALSRLSAALDTHPEASFAYGIIERFSHTGPVGLMSYLGWDPTRLRYGNYIDAMAMLRREAIVEAGGYTTEPDLHGWEDFALWCALAQLGRTGFLVEEILSRYRAGFFSMIAVTNIDTSAAWAALMSRYDVVRP